MYEREGGRVSPSRVQALRELLELVHAVDLARDQVPPGLDVEALPSVGVRWSSASQVWTVMANGGSALGHQLLTESGCAALHAEPIERKMTIMDNRFTQAGLARFDDAEGAKGPLEAGMNVGRDGFYGWMGLGGSVFQWHPRKRIGFAYVPTALNPIDLFNERGKSYQKAVVQCLDTMS